MADSKTISIKPINSRSANITQGKSRAPNRSMYYAMGYEESDFKKPMVGVANGHSTITPCNSGLQKLADAAIAGIEEAGGNAQVFGTPTISDGMAMGTEGMKYSLVSREVISDCIETCVQGQWMDGVVVVGGCDKNMPGGMMGMLRANVPAIYVYGGTILPGRVPGPATWTSSPHSRRWAQFSRRQPDRRGGTAPSIEMRRHPLLRGRAAACTPPTPWPPRWRRSASGWPTRATSSIPAVDPRKEHDLRAKESAKRADRLPCKPRPEAARHHDQARRSWKTPWPHR